MLARAGRHALLQPELRRPPGPDQEGGRADASAAKRPVLYVGGGVISADAHAELRELAELTQIPVTTTLMGLGAFPSATRCASTCSACTATYYANMAVHHSDVLVAVGARFDDRVTGKVDAFAPNAKIIHIDIDPSSISQEHPGGRADRGRLPARAPGADRRREAARRTRRRPRGARRRGTSRSPSGSEQLPAPLRAGTTTSSSPSTSSRRSRRLHAGRRDHRHRRGPAPDVGGPVLQVQAPARAGSPRAGSAPWATGCPTAMGAQAAPSRASSSSTSTATAPSR